MNADTGRAVSAGSVASVANGMELPCMPIAREMMGTETLPESLYFRLVCAGELCRRAGCELTDRETVAAICADWYHAGARDDKRGGTA